jgi:predicted peptidase
MTSRHAMLTPLFVFLLGFSTVQAEIKPTPGKQTEHEITVKVTVEEEGEKVERELKVPFLLYVPKGYDAEGEALPLLLFLHGAGERGKGGEDLQRVAIHGPPKQAKAGKELPFIVVSPQAPPRDGWQGIIGAWQPEVLNQLLDRIEQELNVDKSRVYLTGLSMGGYGSWRLAAATPDRFAAVIPICGGGEPDKWAESLAKVPIWAFHGAKDEVVPLARSQEMVDAVKQAGGDIKFTIYPEARHDSWTATYDDPDVYKWLLEHRRETVPAE